jgi:photosystem II stability/assembly factor-like uncharacterized protein
MKNAMLYLMFGYFTFTGCSKSNPVTPQDPDPTPIDSVPSTPAIPDNKVDTLGNWVSVHKADTGFQANLNPKFTQVMFPTKDTGYLVDAYYFNNVYLKRTYDGGSTWNYKQIPGGLNKFQFLNSNVGFAYEGVITDPKMLGRTRNNGDSWVGYPDLTAPYGPYFKKLSFPSDTAIYALTKIGQVIKITNPLREALYSTIISSDITGTFDDCTNMYFATLKEGWVITSSYSGNSSIYATIDNGITWQKQYDAPGISLYDMFFADNKTGWVTTNKNYFFKTTDGKTWSKVEAKVNTPYPVTTGNIIFLNTERGFMTSGKEVFETNNGGTNWTRICKLGNQTINDMYFTKPDILWVCTENALYSSKL